MKFSLVYPTRHRPKFIEVALEFLEHEAYDDFEVIVSDNYTDASLSCEVYCRNTPIKNIKYIRPPIPLGMVENWNYALQYATGDYICYFTDKMFLLPGTLAYAAEVLGKFPVEMLSWVDTSFVPLNYPDYFGRGQLIPGVSAVLPQNRYAEFDPKEELSKKAFAEVSRSEQSSSDYARGKICFGAYSRNLVDRIQDRAGSLFHNIAPDYTSMILGLSLATSAIEIARPGIVHISTDLSNGGLASIRDEHAFSFLTSLNGGEQLFENLLVPHLYTCAYNMVAHDYISLKNKYGLNHEINVVNWLVYINEELYYPGRIWSSAQIECQQKKILREHIETRLNDTERRKYLSKLKERTSAAAKAQMSFAIKNLLRRFIPRFILRVRRMIRPTRILELNQVRELLIFDRIKVK